MIVHDNNKDDGKIFLILVHVCNVLTVECGYTQNIGNLSIHSAWLLLLTDGGRKADISDTLWHLVTYIGRSPHKYRDR